MTQHSNSSFSSSGESLDPLTSDEMTQVTKIVRKEHNLGEGMRFETIELHETLCFDKPSTAIEKVGRRAFVAAYCVNSEKLFEAVVSLQNNTIISWKEIPGAKPRMGPDEFLDAERLALKDPRFIEALRKRGVTDLSLVCADPWSMGRSDIPEFNKRRLVQTIVWVRNHPGDNHFAHPVEGLSAVIDVNKGEVIRVDDIEGFPIPSESSNYEEQFQKKLRKGLKPIEVVQPEGPSFVVNGHEVEWCGWRFRIGFTAREGLVLHNLEIQDGDVYRSVMKRISIAEMIVPYGSPYGLHTRKNAFDCGEYGLGALANSLKLGCDCLGAIKYFDAVLNGSDGSPNIIENAICMHEEDTGILWKHTDFRTENVDVRRGRKLVISFIATVGNYEYGFYWHLFIDGSIELEVKATGIINTAGIHTEEAKQFGTEVLPGVLGQIHQHIFCIRMVSAIDGSDNSVTEIDAEQLPYGEDNPYENAFRSVETLLETELSACRNADSDQNRFWRIASGSKKNSSGKPCAYRLMPTSCIKALGGERSQLGMRGGFARNHLWVTPTNDDEIWPAGDYVNQSEPGEGLPKWTQADRSVVDKPITIWHIFGLHHEVRMEDFPVQPVVKTSFMIMPDGFFDQNPTLDVPPQKSKNSCLV